MIINNKYLWKHLLRIKGSWTEDEYYGCKDTSRELVIFCMIKLPNTHLQKELYFKRVLINKNNTWKWNSYLLLWDNSKIKGKGIKDIVNKFLNKYPVLTYNKGK